MIRPVYLAAPSVVVDEERVNVAPLKLVERITTLRMLLLYLLARETNCPLKPGSFLSAKLIAASFPLAASLLNRLFNSSIVTGILSGKFANKAGLLLSGSLMLALF